MHTIFIYVFDYNKNSKATLHNSELRYTEPNTGYDIAINTSDIKKVHFKQHIFEKLVLELTGNKQLSLINLSNLKMLKETINAL